MVGRTDDPYRRVLEKISERSTDRIGFEALMLIVGDIYNQPLRLEAIGIYHFRKGGHHVQGNQNL